MLGRREARSPIAESEDKGVIDVPLEVTPPPRPANLTRIVATVHYGCMGLPQELVDRIMGELHDDLTALKACSLTCKAMFASTLHLVHQTLRLYPHTLQKAFADEGEQGYLQYTRRIHIIHYGELTPRTLLPHLHRFQSLDRVHTLIFERYDARTWANHYKPYFVHLYPTLTSLTLRHPSGTYQAFLQFALQFPNLQNLCLETIWIGRSEPTPDPIAPVDRSPPLCGHLQLVGRAAVDLWPVDLVHALPNGMNFRSVQLEDFSGDRVQHILNQCSHTLEALTITLITPERNNLEGLRLARLDVLRRLTFRVAFGRYIHFSEHTLLLEALSTITSSTLSEFVLEARGRPPDFIRPFSTHWQRWESIDAFLEERFAQRRDFKVIIKTGELKYDQEASRTSIRRGFPLLARRGCIHFNG